MKTKLDRLLGGAGNIVTKLQESFCSVKRQKIPVLVLFAIGLLLVYWKVGSNDFINLDTPAYVLENPHVNTGLSLANIKWAFFSTHEGNWHPITWVSHMVDVHIFGLKSGPHHLINLLIHIINSVLVVYFFWKTTKTTWPSVLIGALFAFHPLRVESVAWVAERKDVLSCLFWNLTLISYSRFTERPVFVRYCVVLLAMGLGFMTKAMAVTIPFVMLLLDLWPLDRVRSYGLINKKKGLMIIPWRLVIEKWPFFLLSFMVSIITYYVQDKTGAVGSIDVVPFTERIANALVVYVLYLWKTIWPFNLAVFYPLRDWAAWQVISSLMFLLTVSFLVFKFSVKHKWLVTGWLWYLGSLVPVIGLVQVGSQSMADRYTYIPLIGIYIVFAWSLKELVENSLYLKRYIVTIIVIVMVLLAIRTQNQVSYWKNSVTLYTHALEVTENNPLANYNLGIFLHNHGSISEAAPYLSAALQINPSRALYWFGRGLNYDARGNIYQAEVHYEQALRLDAEHRFSNRLYYYLGVIKLKQGHWDGAEKYLKKSLDFDPNNNSAFFMLGNVMMAQNRLDDAYGYYSEAVKLDPGDAYSVCGLGDVSFHLGHFQEAKGYFEKALMLAPNDQYVRDRYNYIMQTISDENSQKNESNK